MPRAHTDRCYGVRRRGAAARDETRRGVNTSPMAPVARIHAPSRFTVTGRFAAGAGRLGI
jgi:hypothetical protein